MAKKIIKRNGEEVDFDQAKIVNAITKANKEVDRIHQMTAYQIEAVASSIAEQVQKAPHAVNVEDIQDMVETGIMEVRGYEVAQKYVRYRYRSVYCCRRKLFAHIKKESFISMIVIILHRENITAT